MLNAESKKLSIYTNPKNKLYIYFVRKDKVYKVFNWQLLNWKFELVRTIYAANKFAVPKKAKSKKLNA